MAWNNSVQRDGGAGGLITLLDSLKLAKEFATYSGNDGETISVNLLDTQGCAKAGVGLYVATSCHVMGIPCYKEKLRSRKVLTIGQKNTTSSNKEINPKKIAEGSHMNHRRGKGKRDMNREQLRQINHLIQKYDCQRYENDDVIYVPAAATATEEQLRQDGRNNQQQEGHKAVPEIQVLYGDPQSMFEHCRKNLIDDEDDGGSKTKKMYDLIDELLPEIAKVVNTSSVRLDGSAPNQP